ncbi:hypothetical protein [Lacticaseibacillus kribbianus]|uniref:hypothetical protein n=1 Tax=Lacticaseibacillus kribbianus TaxID=2926292 RepID=UPI001CD3F80B|nr:hypothetical protein [Lacticaseibacillus kribbianus]
MKVLYKGRPAAVWTIAQEGEQPAWVRRAFAENYLVWLDGHVRILMAGLNPDAATNLRVGAVGTLGGGFAGYGMYVLGYPGDVLDATNHRVVSPRQFARQYRVVDPVA